MVAADAGPAYAKAGLLRTLVTAPEYVLDHFRVFSKDALPHDVDWVYHNAGTLTTALPLAPYSGLPTQNGYQHLTRLQFAATADDWNVTFDATSPPGMNYGSVWPSVSSATGTFTYSQGNAFRGKGSGQLTYDFAAATGYILYSTPAPPALDEAPQKLRLALYGDGSGNSLTLRVYDATNERFACAIGPLNWTGWKVLTTGNMTSCSHYLGNNDGIFDLPAKQAAIEIGYKSGNPTKNSLFVDDITLIYPYAGEQLIADFEIETRGLSLRMKGETGTTVVTGDGLGLDLKAVPFAMARRRALSTTFISLLEPIGETSIIRSLALLTSSASPADEAVAVAIAAPGFDDRLLAVADGAPVVRRTFGTAACDGVLCFIRRNAQGRYDRLVLMGGTQLQEEQRVIIDSQIPLSGLQVDYADQGTTLQLRTESPFAAKLRIWGPEVRTVWVNGSATNFVREGEYVSLQAMPKNSRKK
jgi:hypothetical protein